MRKAGVVVASIGLAFLLAACAGLGEPAARLGDQKLSLYLADTDAERSTGLQEFDGLAPGEAMLFVYPDAEPRTFVMRKVGFAIDIAFIGEDGRVSAIEPLDPKESRLVDSPGPSRYVLELPQGWAEQHHITVGTAFEYDTRR